MGDDMSDSRSEGRIGRSARKRWIIVAVACVIVALLAGFGAGFLGGRAAGTSGPSPSKGTAVGSPSGSCNAVTVANEVLPTIVTIHADAAGGSAAGVGSGEIVRKDGYIVTNNHVIFPAVDGGSLSVVYSSGEQVPATLVGRDPKSDLAVLKVKPDAALPVIDLANSDRVAVGQPVVALGAPLGLSSTVTAGIVSALDRDVPVPSDNDTTTVLAGALQTDAAINPGNSGGALVDCSGALVGVNTAIATVPNAEGTAGGGSVGIGFAVPSNLANRIVGQLIDNGKATYPYVGVQVAPIPPTSADRFEVDEGLYVVAVSEGGPAAAAGLRPGDVITRIDGRSATDMSVLTRVTLTKKPGAVVAVTYVRDGTQHMTRVTLGAQ